jgi:cysteine synthase
MATGTGGTFGGCSTFLKEKNPNILCYIMESVGVGVKYVYNAGKTAIEMIRKPQEEKSKEASPSLTWHLNDNAFL